MPVKEYLKNQKNRYGSLIREQRIKNGLETEDLANICLMQPEEMMAVERGEKGLESYELDLIGNVLGISGEALQQGKLEYKTGREELAELIEALAHAVANVREAGNQYLKALENLQRRKPYHVRPMEQCYAIYDTERDAYVAGEDGAVRQYATAKEALQEARELNRLEEVVPTVGTDNIPYLYGVTDGAGGTDIFRKDGSGLSEDGQLLASADPNGEITYYEEPTPELEREIEQLQEETGKVPPAAKPPI